MRIRRISITGPSLAALLGSYCCLTGLANAAPLLENGDFEQSTRSWEVPGFWAGGSGQTIVEAGRLCTTVTEEGTDDWGAQLRQTALTLFGGAPYSLSFRVWSSVDLTLPVNIIDEPNDFADIFSTDIAVSAPLDGEGQLVSLEMTASTDTSSANFRFMLGGGILPAGQTLCLDDVVLNGPVNLVDNSTFEDGTALGWETGFWGSTGQSLVDSQRLCAEIVTGGEETWNVQLRVNDLPLRTDRSYTVSADVWSSAPGTVEMIAIDEGDDYKRYFGGQFDVAAPLDGTPSRVLGSFVADKDTDAVKLSFHMGGGLVPDGTTVCLDNVRLLDPIAEPPAAEPPPPPIHVHQMGYLPGYSKLSTYALPVNASDVANPRQWDLVQEEQIVATGMTLPFGSDAASGDHVHHIDFSQWDSEGTGYTLRITEGDSVIESFPFSIAGNLYEGLQYDALAYFYHNRSGTPILAEVVGEPWSRPAGHLSDSSVPLYECEEEPCPLVAAAGGWYDAGDHGKYVVNGGISAWTLLHQYERAIYLGGNKEAFADGTMQLPEAERTNGIPDLLDEARWEVEWLLKMQIPAGQALEGLAYHKLHDVSWTALPTAPHEDDQARSVHPPSTAATLNVAAVAAQSARIWRHLDPKFAEQCLQAARLGFDAALAYPDLLAPGNADGGGGYTDGTVSDEFYWAATELYITTGESQYADQMSGNPAHLVAPVPTEEGGFSAAMDWQRTSSLGLISLATAGPRFGANWEWLTEARANLVQAADLYKSWISDAGYASALAEDGYDWGSNSRILNNLLVLGLAHDFTCDPSYAEALHEGAGYIFGRNPLGHSYVTGYGTRTEKYPHHRFWAEVLDPDFPPAPAGAVSGGPNPGLQDPMAQWLEGCAPQRCFLDEIHAWSLNEITINWNAPLAAVTAYLNELGDPKMSETAANRCEWRSRFASQLEEDSDKSCSSKHGKKHKHGSKKFKKHGFKKHGSKKFKKHGFKKHGSKSFKKHGPSSGGRPGVNSHGWSGGKGQHNH